ncbi:MAG: hypothetical protein QME75_13490 [Deltaproteobacteria bacterium]|nr:hypothetical protein [Deltaproteobacteria bacterium]
MKKATAVILAGLVLLFLISLFAGHKLFSASERELSRSYHSPSTTAAGTQGKVDFRKFRMAFSSFDLAAGLTPRDMEAISTQSLAFPFYFLLASLWLVLGLRKPRRG